MSAQWVNASLKFKKSKYALVVKLTKPRYGKT